MMKTTGKEDQEWGRKAGLGGQTQKEDQGSRGEKKPNYHKKGVEAGKSIQAQQKRKEESGKMK